MMLEMPKPAWGNILGVIAGFVSKAFEALNPKPWTRVGGCRYGCAGKYTSPKGPKFPCREHLPEVKGQFLLQKPYFVPCSYLGLFCF